jgi:hypothetical protein
MHENTRSRFPAGAGRHRIATATGVPQSLVSKLMNDRGVR